LQVCIILSTNDNCMFACALLQASCRANDSIQLVVRVANLCKSWHAPTYPQYSTVSNHHYTTRARLMPDTDACDLHACAAATAGELLRQGLHTAEILEGYKRAFEKCMEELPSLVCHTVEDVRDKAQLVYAIKTTLASKQYGFEVSALTHCCAATTALLVRRVVAVSAAVSTDCSLSSSLMLLKL
jgi:TCP-1/cpn60 chaperonin family